MIIHNIELTKAGLGLSGGEVCLLELVKCWRAMGHTNIVYTSENGIATYTQNGLAAPDVEYCCVGSYAVEQRFGVLVSWWLRTCQSRRHVRRLDHPEQHLIVSHSDFFPSVLFARWLKNANPEARWIAFNHMLAPNPFKGVKYQYVKGKFILPSLAGLYYWFSQQLFFRWQRQADLLVGVNPSYQDCFAARNRQVLFIRLGADACLDAAQQVEPAPVKRYDACFIGRFHEQKGIFELVDIVERIVRAGQASFSCALVGDYHNPIGREVQRRIAQKQLGQNITLLGSCMGASKYAVLAQSKVLILPSYYESFAIVYLEAISMGLPVFEYDLPFFQDHQKGVVKTPFLDNQAMAVAILDLLSDAARYTRLSAEGRDYATHFSWARAAADILRQVGLL